MKALDSTLRKPPTPHLQVIFLAGDIDAQRRGEMADLIRAFVSSPAVNALVDLVYVTFFDTTRLGFLARLRRAATARRGTVSFAPPRTCSAR